MTDGAVATVAQRCARFFGQLREAFGHLRQGELVERVASIEQAVAGFADEADALGNAGKERNQRRFDRIGQDVGALVAALCQLPGEAVAGLQREVAVRERAVDDLRDFRHAFEYRGNPARRQGIELQAGKVFVQTHEQRMGQHGVANPGGGDDQGFHA